MHRRSVSYSTLKHRPDRKAPAVLDSCHGRELLHLFHAYAKSLSKDALRNDTKGTYVAVADVQAHGRAVLVRLEYGRFGEPGNTYDVRNHVVSHERTADDAPTDSCRLLFICPKGSDTALFAAEAVAGSSGAPALIDAFKHALADRWGNDYWPLDRVYEKDDWLDLAELKQLTAVYYGWKRDLVNGTTPKRKVYGRLERSLFPEVSGGSLPSILLKNLRAKKLNASTVMGFEEDELGQDQEPDAVLAKVMRDGREKTIELGHERVPSVRVVFSDAGSPPLNDPAFMQRCLDEANELYEGMTGQKLLPSLLDGSWSTSDLALTW